jgi:hypothetical protein
MDQRAAGGKGSPGQEECPLQHVVIHWQLDFCLAGLGDRSCQSFADYSIIFDAPVS